LHRIGLKHLGAKSVYSVWLIVPLSAIFTLLTPYIVPWVNTVFEIIETNSNKNIINILTLAFPGQARRIFSSVDGHQLIITAWLLGVLSMSLLLAAEGIALKRYNSARFGRLRLRRNDHIKTPGIFGIFAPTIQLPLSFTKDYSALERRLILCHELMHWRRGDTRINVIAWLMLSLQWFNPLMWLCYRRFRADQELACDADVLARHKTGRTPDESASIYAKALLKTVTKSSLNRGRGSISLRPCSTHYGYKQGNFTMIKERFNNLNIHHHTRRLPTYVCSILACSFALLWQLPAYSQAETTSSAAETKPLMPIVRIEPRYPEHAASKGIEGYVDLSFVISNDGKTQDITVTDSKPAGVFDEVVVAAVEHWRYQPQDNKRTKVRVQMTMDNEQ
jgi:TonB family protein